MKKVTNKDVPPAGKKGECFWCKAKVGEEHKFTCVTQKHKVKVRYIIELERDEPISWSDEDIEFHLNESSWCASNIIDELGELEKKGCLCGTFKGEVIKKV